MMPEVVLYDIDCDICGDTIGKCSVDVSATEEVYCTKCNPEVDDNEDAINGEEEKDEV